MTDNPGSMVERIDFDALIAEAQRQKEKILKYEGARITWRMTGDIDNSPRPFDHWLDTGNYYPWKS